MKPQCNTSADCLRELARGLPDQAELLRLFDYDKEAGVFIRAISVSPRGQKGAIAGYVSKNGYVFIGINGADWPAHRLAWKYVHGDDPRGVIDHIDGNPSNNRITNLRDVTQSLNMLNVHKCQSNNKSSKMRGVSFDKKYGKFFAQLRGEILGYFDTAELARESYLIAKEQACKAALEKLK